jgi:signal transduction histidine kinase
MKTLINRTMARLTICLVGILLLCMPLFYYLTTRFYAEDLIDVVDAYRSGKKIDENIDLESDVVVGLTIQYGLIALVIGAGVVITMRLVTRKIWQPFNTTLSKVESFKLGKDNVPEFPPTDIYEFNRLNTTLTHLLQRNTTSYKVRKEFSENASHELQTPIAIIRSDLDMLLQEDLNEKESELIGDIYDVTRRLEQLYRSLLVLAKIENNQYEEVENVSLPAFIDNMLPQYNKLYKIPIHYHQQGDLTVRANHSLLGIVFNNLVVNALRNAAPETIVDVSTDDKSLSVTNESMTGQLDEAHLFSRFNQMGVSEGGHGLGLALVKQACDHYQWDVTYLFDDHRHTFQVTFVK